MPARRRRSISTAWCGTIICANAPNSANCRSTLPRAGIASGRATTSRSICGSASRPSAFPPAPASRWSRCRPGRRCWRRCWPKSMDPMRRRAARSPRELKKIFAEVPFIVDIDEFDRRAAAAAAAVDRPGPARIFRRRAARRLRHHPDAVRRRIGRLFAPRRGSQSDRDRRQTAEARSGLERGAGLDAGARQHAARQQDGGRTRPGRQGDRRGGLADRSSAATAASPTW